MDTDLFFETETNDMFTDAGADGTQIAAVPSAAAPFDDALPRPFDATQVLLPEGATVVRIPVAPGEFVELPFPADAHFLARIDDGNLAIKVGDVTVILQGYVEAAGQTAPVIEAANGHPLDIATILAATDPAIEIETAAGPAGPQGQGADNTGAFFQQLGEVGGLGGLQSVGAQDGTDGMGSGGTVDQTDTVEQTGTLFVQFGHLTEVNVPPTFRSGVDHITLLGEDIVNSVPLHWVITDPDDAGHTITVDPSTLPDGVTYDSKTETIYFDTVGKYDSMKGGELATFTLKFTITDDRGASTEHDVILGIHGSNDKPVAVDDVILIDASAATATFPLWALAANDKDAEGDALHTSALEIIPFVGDETITTHPPAVGDSSISYTVSDGKADSVPGTVTFKHDAIGDGDINGTLASEILVGTGAKETLDGGGGDDIVDGHGGGDEIFGGDGDDTLVFYTSVFFNSDRADGQTDTVALSGGLASGADKHGDILAFGDAKLDFSDHASVAGRDGIETISMQAKLGGFTAQSLTIGAASVQDLSDHTITPGGVFAEHDAVRIDGDAVDQLYLSISKDGGQWVDASVELAGYHVYAHETTPGSEGSTDAYVMVAAAVPTANVHLNADAP